jgi:group I intron endonuclease
MRINKLTGIYQIQSKLKPERIYIGSASDIFGRWCVHTYDLRRGKHHSPKLQRHYNKYGIVDLQLSILICCDKDDLIKTEQFFIDSYKPYFNVCEFAANRLGIKHTEASKLKMSLSRKSVPFTEEHKNNMKGPKTEQWHISNERIRRRIPIYQLTITGIFLKEWRCATDASRELKINLTCINECLNYKQKTAGGFKWKYKLK